MIPDLSTLCVCGHGPTTHEHLDGGSECGLCGCTRYRHQYNRFQRFLMWLGF